MRLAVTGAAGMLGRAVCAAAARVGHDVVALTRDELDVTDQVACDRVLERERPHVVVNCAAWTDVDGAEAQRDASFAVNATGAGNVARAAAEASARVVQVSTDYVFDGTKATPYVESDPTGPGTAYGQGKLRGELEVAAATPEHAIARTAWLFGAGGPNFVATMLRLAETRDEVEVVTDQVGSPTWTNHLADGLLELAERREFGIFHLAGSGSCSWNELALEAFDQAGVRCRVLPTTSERFVRPAARPAFSVLASEREDPIVLPPWQDGVRGYVNERMATV